MRSFQRKFRKLQRSVVTSLVLLLCLGTAQANWYDFIEDTYGDYDIEINYYDDFNDFMGNASDNAVDSYFDALSGIDYEDSNDSDYVSTLTNKGTTFPNNIDNSNFEHYADVFGDVSITYNKSRGYNYSNTNYKPTAIQSIFAGAEKHCQ